MYLKAMVTVKEIYSDKHSESNSKMHNLYADVRLSRWCSCGLHTMYNVEYFQIKSNDIRTNVIFYRQNWKFSKPNWTFTKSNWALSANKNVYI